MDLNLVCKVRFPDLPYESAFSFARNTTIGCGGVADLAVYPRSIDEAAAVISFLYREKIPHCFLGAGANTLPPDGRYEGVVVRFSRMTELCAGEELYAGAGVSGGALLRFAYERSLTGFEPFVGIPMTVGGATVMNAGIPAGHISDVALRVVGLEKGKVRVFTQKECLFSEKVSVFQSEIAVLGVYFRMERGDRAAIERNLSNYRERRKHLPKGRSMGCTFVNPKAISAGRLIDECGLKGLRCGGAYISPVHANFIINEGGSAKDVAQLAEAVKQTVYLRTGILLREEYRTIGTAT